MNKEGAIGFVLLGVLLGGLLLLAHRSALAPSHTSAPRQLSNPRDVPGEVNVVPVGREPPRYKNEEIRTIEYNDLGLPTKIKITRDYAIA